MLFTNSTAADMEQILALYEEAISFQKLVCEKHWPAADTAQLEREISERRHWKIIEPDGLASYFSIAYNDRLLWGDRDDDPSVYVHRIVKNREFTRHYAGHIFEWALAHTRSLERTFLRLNTWAGNKKLLNYYLGFGFTPAGEIVLGDFPHIPVHYRNTALSLLEIKV